MTQGVEGSVTNVAAKWLKLDKNKGLNCNIESYLSTQGALPWVELGCQATKLPSPSENEQMYRK